MFENIAKMRPVQKRTSDNQYQNLLKEVLDTGVKTESQQGVDALTVIGPRNLHFKLENGFPIINERNMAPRESDRLPVTIWKQAIGEIFAFANGARRLEKIKSFGCNWWDPWATEEKCKSRGLESGDLGPGSYGAAFHDFPTAEGENFNQFETIIRQIKERPHLRTHFITPWVPQYTARIDGRQQKVTICPCHGWVHIRIINNKLTLHMFQRSADIPVGVPSNMVQYAAITMAIAHVTGTIPYEFVHSFSDAHIYVNQIEAVKTMLEREPRPLATMKINTGKKDFFDFRYSDFELSDYNPHPGIKAIPVAI